MNILLRILSAFRGTRSIIAEQATNSELTIGGVGWREWFKRGVRCERGGASGSALSNYEYALALAPDNKQVAAARLRVAKVFANNPNHPHYKKLVAGETFSLTCSNCGQERRDSTVCLNCDARLIRSR